MVRIDRTVVDTPPSKRQKILDERKSLPIATVEKRLVEEVRKNDTLIIVGDTGTGKTTQLPQFLYNGGFCHDGGLIGITQPRRVAAVTVANRVAEECGSEVGQRVGYAIRFEDVTSTSTRIKYMTDGLLLREAILDPYLSRYSVIIIDEAHERTVNTDVLLGLLKRVQKTRSQCVGEQINMDLTKDRKNKSTGVGDLHLGPGKRKKSNPLKLIIMSASLDAGGFSEFFNHAKAVHVQGRQFPVDIYYTYLPQTDCVEAALITIFQIHLEEDPGDILVFLTGQEEIESVERLVQNHVRKLPEGNQKLLTFPIFSSLPPKKQLKVFTPAPPGFRKVILATNIAETSVTIPGIKYVIDPGLVKVRNHCSESGIDSLMIVKTSKSQAHQRSGRAGREGAGKCFRLYQESYFDKLADSTVPEIRRLDLSNVMLQLKALGVDDILEFDFMEKPDEKAVIRSLETLVLLGALTKEGQLSDPIGKHMARLPLDPMDSKAILLAIEFGCLQEMIINVSMLSVESIYYAPSDKLEQARTKLKCFSSPEGDQLTLINIYRNADELFEKSKTSNSKEIAEKNLRNWCKENFINNRSLRRARDIHSQILDNVTGMGFGVSSCGDNMLQFRRCLAASFFLNAALKQHNGSYRVYRNGQIAQIHPSSVLFRSKPKCIIFKELIQTRKSYVRNVTRIDPLWLTELAPQYFGLQQETSLNIRDL